jgi:uncharacterized glyoxalase superfamily protein PhnB
MASNPTLYAAVPTFIVDDAGATARWYVEALGFHLTGHFPMAEPYVYASVQRGQAEIILLGMPGYRKPDGAAGRPGGSWDAYIRMAGVRLLFELWQNREFIQMPLKKQPYGDWEFEVRDPNGYVLVFGGDVDVQTA